MNVHYSKTENTLTIGTPDGKSIILPVDEPAAISLRDHLNAIYPPDENWRKNGEWEEIPLSEARPGDIAEFVREGDGQTYRGKLSMDDGTLSTDDDLLIIRFEDFDGPSPGFSWVVRCGNGRDGGRMKDLHIWRKLDPHRFDEPEEKGLYISRSGRALYNNGTPCSNWQTVDSLNPYVCMDNWDSVRVLLDDSEFPLVKATPEMLGKVLPAAGNRREESR